MGDKVEYWQRWLEHEYPVTILSDRYRGAYSGGRFVALPLEPQDVPEEIYSGDADCTSFWYDQKEGGNPIKYGIGSSPQEAFDNLRETIKRISRSSSGNG